MNSYLLFRNMNFLIYQYIFTRHINLLVITPETQTQIVAKNNAKKDSKSTPYEISDAKNNVNKLITKENKPNVKILIGKVIKVKTGRITALIALKITAKKNASSVSFITNPGISLPIKITTSRLMIKRKSKNIYHLMFQCVF